MYTLLSSSAYATTRSNGNIPRCMGTSNPPIKRLIASTFSTLLAIQWAPCINSLRIWYMSSRVKVISLVGRWKVEVSLLHYSINAISIDICALICGIHATCPNPIALMCARSLSSSSSPSLKTLKCLSWLVRILMLHCNQTTAMLSTIFFLVSKGWVNEVLLGES